MATWALFSAPLALPPASADPCSDVAVVFEQHGKEWAGFVLYDQDENEYFLLCVKEELVPLLDRYLAAGGGVELVVALV